MALTISLKKGLSIFGTIKLIIRADFLYKERAASLGLNPVSLITVSYTHLDVYKRQK